MVRFIVSTFRHFFLVKRLGLAIRLWVICRSGRVIVSGVPKIESEELAYKLKTVKRKQVGWDPKRYYPIINEVVRNVRLIRLRRRDRSREFGPSVCQCQEVLIVFRCPWLETRDVRCYEVQRTKGRREL